MNKPAIFLFSVFLLFASELFSQAIPDYAVQLSVQVQKSPAKIILNWTPNTSATGYMVFRKSRTAPKWGNAFATLPGTAASWTDNNVTPGMAYEYYVRRQGSNFTGHGYALAGMEVPAKEDPGTVILMVDDTFAVSLAAELKRLEHDLRMEGWMVLRHDVKRSDSVTAVKALIKKDYLANPDKVRTVFLIGHVPVPYSGFYAIDGHGDHQGAWAADAYYGDMDGTWYDVEPLAVTSASRKENWNKPGDGKFDDDIIPSPIDLEIGRVDMYDLPAFSLSEADLLKRYLDKDHAFRTKIFTVKNRALIDDHFGPMGGEAFAASGYKAFAPMFGDSNITAGDYRTLMKDDSYLWSYGTGPGTYVSASGVARTDSFVNDSLKTVFTMLFGSYFGDFDSKNNLLRASLASRGFTLTSCWSGRPHWVLHHMALGENIGYSTRISQSDTALYMRHPIQVFGAFRQTALLGDPTLRMHITAAPRNITLSHLTDSTQIKLSWKPAKDTLIKGYYIYRIKNSGSSFTRIDSVSANDTTYLDLRPEDGWNIYMVRAIKLQESGSGSYYNLSPGIIDSTIARKVSGIRNLAATGAQFRIYPNPTAGLFNIVLSGVTGNHCVVSVRDVLGKLVHEESINSSSSASQLELDISTQPKGIYIVTIKTPEAYITRRLVKNN